MVGEGIRMTIDEGKIEIGEILSEHAEKENVSIDRVIWFDDGTSESPPTRFTLQVYGTTGAIADKRFTPDHLTQFKTDNQLLMQVHQKIAAIVARLR
jgi:hypothetical protein